MSCPMWRPDCQAAAVADAGFSAVRGARAVANVAGDGVHVARSLGGFLPLIIVVLVLWALSKFVGAGKRVAVAVADGYTGGGASRAESVKQVVVKRAHDKGRSMRVVREGGRGPQVQAHTGQPGIIKRVNDQTGKPKTVTVCAGDPGTATSLVNQRMNGSRWTLAGSKPCPHQKAPAGNQVGGGKDFTFTRRK